MNYILEHDARGYYIYDRESDDETFLPGLDGSNQRHVHDVRNALTQLNKAYVAVELVKRRFGI